MKRRSLLLITVLLVALLAALSVPAHAGPPDNATGTWNYGLVEDYQYQVGCNIFWPMTDEGIFDGTFVGTETEVGMVVIHCNGKMSYKGNLSFEGTVAGSDWGTMEMRNVGTFNDQEMIWEGKWKILHGTGGLANLRGQGTWWGPPGSLQYAGNYHFEPD